MAALELSPIVHIHIDAGAPRASNHPALQPKKCTTIGGDIASNKDIWVLSGMSLLDSVGLEFREGDC